MLTIDARTPVRYTPPWLANQSDPPVFLIRAGTVLERQMFEADLAGRFNARTVWPHELREALDSGIRALADVDDQERLLRVAAGAVQQTLTDEGDKALFTSIDAQFRVHWPPYHALQQRIETRRALIPVLAFMKFVVGWEYVFAIDDAEPLVFARDTFGYVDQAVLGRLDPLVMRVVGSEAYQMLTPSEAQRKNSAPRSKSGGARKTSTSPPRKPASTGTGGRKAGSSTARAGGATPAPKSPKTSGRR